MDENKKVSDQPDTTEAGTEVTKSAYTNLLDKIRATLASTTPERWEVGGEPLDAKRKFSRAQETWEQVYFTDTKSGVLVLRCSIPLSNSFVGGGYLFSPSGPTRFLIELRAKGWSPKALVDPSFRGAGGVERQVQVLAEGEIAERLYSEIDGVVKEHRESLRRDFNDAVARLTANIKEQIGETTAADWQVVEGDFGVKGYRTEINNLTVTTACSVSDISTSYSLTVSRYGLTWRCRDPFLMQEVYILVDESVKTASLEQLGKVLDDML